MAEQFITSIWQCIVEAHRFFISFAAKPVWYLECPFEHPECKYPHIPIDPLKPMDVIKCPKIDKIVPKSKHDFLFTSDGKSLYCGTVVMIVWVI